MDQDDVAAYPRDSPRPEQGSAQKTCLHSPRTRNVLEDDLALARVLQEQERAFFLFQSGAPGYEAEEGEQAEEEEALDDEAYARRLASQEQMEAYRQMLAAQGIDVVNLEQAVEGADTDGMTYDDLSMLGEVAGSVNKGLPQEVISQIPTVVYDNLLQSMGPAAMDKCCICQLEFELSDEVSLLPCNHHYHKECVSQWLCINKVCPVCNTELSNHAA